MIGDEIPSAPAFIDAGIASYYTRKLHEHGPTHRGVDWNSEASQVLRFDQLLNVAEALPPGPYSINDYGCGYGALLDVLDSRGERVAYTGFDIAPAMIGAARARHGSRDDCVFTTDWHAVGQADVSVASGVFNVRLATGEGAWRDRLWRALTD